MPAGHVEPGHGLWVHVGGVFGCSPVESVRRAAGVGKYVPVTTNANIVVDGVSASVACTYEDLTDNVLSKFGVKYKFPTLPFMLKHPVMLFHIRLNIAMYTYLGRLGLAINDFFQAGGYALSGVPQSTNAFVAAKLDAAGIPPLPPIGQSAGGTGLIRFDSAAAAGAEATCSAPALRCLRGGSGCLQAGGACVATWLASGGEFELQALRAAAMAVLITPLLLGKRSVTTRAGPLRLRGGWRLALLLVLAAPELVGSQCCCSTCYNTVRARP